MPRPTHSLADNAILVIGAQRSGTTWLGKIFDSHPDVLYRHEPDQNKPTPDPAHIKQEVEALIHERRPRAAGKRPFFTKGYQSAAGHVAREAIWAAIELASRVPVLRDLVREAKIPDFADIDAQTRLRPVLKSIDWCDGVGDFARALPGSRTVAILRHPCGQVASVMRGNQAGRFALREEGTDMPFNEAPTVRFAAAHGVDEPTFQALPVAGRYAWDWARFNAAALREAEVLPNVRIVVYEDLCRDPIGQTRALFEFVGLNWHRQTETFLRSSTTHEGPSGYYAVFRNSAEAAEKWRTTMDPADQEAVRSVVRRFPVARYWGDLGE